MTLTLTLNINGQAPVNLTLHPQMSNECGDCGAGREGLAEAEQQAWRVWRTHRETRVGRSSECGEWAVHRERLEGAKRECGECLHGSRPFAPGVLTDPWNVVCASVERVWWRCRFIFKSFHWQGTHVGTAERVWVDKLRY